MARLGLALLLTVSFTTVSHASAGVSTQRRGEHAVIVGSGTATALRHTDDDAARVAALFAAAGVQTSLLVTADAETRKRYAAVVGEAAAPTAAGLRRAFQNASTALAADTAAGLRTQLYLFFSGIGSRVGASGPVIRLQDEAVTLAELAHDMMADVDATDGVHVVMSLCDGCGNDAVASDGDRWDGAQAYLDALDLDNRPGAGAIIALVGDARVYDQEPFHGSQPGYALHAALTGAADVDQDGLASYVEVASFVTAATRAADKGSGHGGKAHVTWYAPDARADAPLFATAGHDARAYVLLPDTVLGRVAVEQGRQDTRRYLDVNKAADTALFIALVPGHDYRISAPSTTAAVHARAGATLTVSWQPASNPGKARPTLVPEGSFDTPFGASFVRGFAAADAAQREQKGRPGTSLEPRATQTVDKARIAVTVGAGGDATLGPYCTNALLGGLRSAGHQVVDSSNLKMVRSSWSLADIDSGNAPLDLSTVDADLLLAATVTAEGLGRLRSSSLESVRAQLTFRLLHVADAQTALADAVTGSGIAVGKDSAARRAVQQAAERATKRIAEAVAKFRSRPRRIDLTVQALTPVTRASEVASNLQRLAAVKQARVRLQSPKLTRMDVVITASTALDLASAIAAEPGTQLEVVQASRGSLVTRYAPLRGNQIRLAIAAPVQQTSPELTWLGEALPELIAAELQNRTYIDAQLPTGTAETHDAALRLTSTIREDRAGRAVLVIAHVGEKRSGRQLTSARLSIPREGLVEGVQSLARQLSDELEAALVRRTDIVGAHQLALGTSDPQAKPPAGEQEALHVKKVRVGAIFPAHINHYAERGLARLSIENAGGRPIDEVAASVHVPGYMELPQQRACGKLGPGEARTCALPAALDAAKVSTTTETTPVQLSVHVRYKQGDVWRSMRRVVPTVVQHRNALDWGETAGVAAFVTPRDPTVMAVAGAVLEATSGAGLPPPLAAAAGVVEALAKAGVRYHRDADLPYQPRGVDHLQYPVETLATRRGDCDDLSVLMAACLEALGVRTALVTTPEHLLLLADSGLPAGFADRATYQGPRWVAHRGRLWIPLESTVLEHGFVKTWQAGAEEVERWKGQRQFLPLERAWRRFPPAATAAVRPDGTDSAGVPPAADPAALRERLSALGQTLKRSQSESVGRAIAEAQQALAHQPQKVDAAVRLAQLLADAARVGEAEKTLRATLSRLAPSTNERERAALEEALANLHLLNGEPDRAAEIYARLAKDGGLSAEGYANYGLAGVAMDRLADAQRAYAESSRRGGRQVLERVARRRTVGPPSPPPSTSRDAARGGRVDARVVQEVLDRVLRATPATHREPPGAPKPTPAPTLLSGGRRGSAPDSLHVAALVIWPK